MSDDNGDAVESVMAEVRDIGRDEIDDLVKFAEWEAAVRAAVERLILDVLNTSNAPLAAYEHYGLLERQRGGAG